MQNTSADLLEFDALKRLLDRYVSSPMGHAHLESLQPGTDRAVIEAALAEVAEAIAYIKEGSQPKNAARTGLGMVRFDGLPDPTVHAARLRIEGASLDGLEIAELLLFLDRAADIRGMLTGAADRFPLLARCAAVIGDFNALLKDFSGKILPDGSLDDHASVALNRIRRDMEKQQRAIHESLERFLRAHKDEGVLQEDFVAIRNERFVVPVIAGQKRKIDGVIHGASGSGQTLFVEPLETIHLNNDLVRLREEEAREVHRILREMTARLREQSADISITVGAIRQLEVVFAKARFATEFACVIPRFSPPAAGRRLLLREARHPLLEDVLRRHRKAVVPISLTLDPDTSTLLISGPNTGGKTVTLKTAGLLALMAQAALPVPAAEAEFPIFDQVLADIGDQQSISESLSTFSAHITRVREMLLEVTADSLVLLDELGRATDPEEGGALGVAVLDYFRRAGAMTLASTHLLAIKVYGATSTGVLNGSMGFNDATLEPTYVLRTGAPGKSAGLEIASRLGVPAELIDRARAAMGTNEREVSRFLSELHQRLENVGRLERDLEDRNRAVAAREASLAREWEKRESAKLRELERRTAEAMDRFEAQAREALGQIEQTAAQRKAVEQAARKVSKTRREFQQDVRAAMAPPGSAESKPAAPKFEEGSRVRLEGVRELARVRRLLNDNRLEVEVGLLRMQVNAEDVIEVLAPAAEPARLPAGITLKQSGPAWDSSYREINIIGQRADEASDNVDKFLDQAALASVDRVRIVHGFGMGVLKRTVSDLLSRCPHVSKFYPATPQEGGGGATIVELK
jgi:DNA mismatch repair protein MutS2